MNPDSLAPQFPPETGQVYAFVRKGSPEAMNERCRILDHTLRDSGLITVPWACAVGILDQFLRDMFLGHYVHSFIATDVCLSN